MIRRGSSVVLAALLVAGCAGLGTPAPQPVSAPPGGFPWALWTMYMGTTPNAYGSNYHWKPSGRPPMSMEACRAVLKETTGQRFVAPVLWYTASGDPRTWFGCWPGDGYDPEDPPK